MSSNPSINDGHGTLTHEINVMSQATDYMQQGHHDRARGVIPTVEQG